MFPPKSPLFKVLMMSLEAMFCLSVTMFLIELNLTCITWKLLVSEGVV